MHAHSQCQILCTDEVQQGPKAQTYVFIQLSITHTSYMSKFFWRLVPALEIATSGHYTRGIEITFLCSDLTMARPYRRKQSPEKRLQLACDAINNWMKRYICDLIYQRGCFESRNKRPVLKHTLNPQQLTWIRYTQNFAGETWGKGTTWNTQA